MERGRFTVVAFPSERRLAQDLLAVALRADSFPGLARPEARVTIALAPDSRRFREWGGSEAPEWGIALAFPESQRIVMQGRNAASDAGDPRQVLRHELAHLALHEALGELPPRWFDEGYASVAAGEWGRDEVLRASAALVFRRTPTLAELETRFAGGAGEASTAYALAHRAVAHLAALDPDRGLAVFFDEWKRSRSFDTAVRRAYGLTETQFEQRWQRQLRRSYGLVAALTDLSAASLLMIVLLGPAYVARRRRDRRRLEALRDAERRVAVEEEPAEGERAAGEASLDALMEGANPPARNPPADAAVDETEAPPRDRNVPPVA